MQLLSPEIIKDEKKAGAEEARIRVNALGREETQLVFRINILKDEEADYLKRKKEREEQGLQGMITGDVEEIIGVSTRKTVLTAEVEALEKRRATAMQPVEEVRREANALMANAQQAALVNDELAKALKKDEEDIAARKIALKKAEDQSVADRKAKAHDLDLREIGIKAGEEEVKRLIADFAGKVAAHTTKVAADSEAMAKRETTVQQNQRINEIEAERLTKRSTEQDERERGLQRERRALDVAKEKTP